MLAPRLAKIGRRQVEIRPKTDPREFKHSLQHHNGPSAFWNNSPTFFFVFLSKSEGRGGILAIFGLCGACLGPILGCLELSWVVLECLVAVLALSSAVLSLSWAVLGVFVAVLSLS